MASFLECIESDDGNGAIGLIDNEHFMGRIEIWQSMKHPRFFYVDTMNVRSGLWETTKRPVKPAMVVYQIAAL